MKGGGGNTTDVFAIFFAKQGEIPANSATAFTKKMGTFRSIYTTTRLLTTSQSWFQNSFRNKIENFNFNYQIFLDILWWSTSSFSKLDFFQVHKMRKRPRYKMRKHEYTIFQWSKVSRLLTTLPRHRPDFRTGLRFSFWAPEVTFLKWGKPVKVAFSQNGHFWCPKPKSETCSEIRSATW